MYDLHATSHPPSQEGSANVSQIDRKVGRGVEVRRRTTRVERKKAKEEKRTEEQREEERGGRGKWREIELRKQ